jgi:hypothetical protein
LAESTASLGGEYRISRRRVPHLLAESTSSLGKEYFISRRRVPHLKQAVPAACRQKAVCRSRIQRRSLETGRACRRRVLHLSESGTGQT